MCPVRDMMRFLHARAAESCMVPRDSFGFGLVGLLCDFQEISQVLVLLQSLSLRRLPSRKCLRLAHQTRHRRRRHRPCKVILVR
jgi:hypothetical protein